MENKAMAISLICNAAGSVMDGKITPEMYSAPISATPVSDAAFEINMIQLMAKAIEGWYP